MVTFSPTRHFAECQKQLNNNQPFNSHLIVKSAWLNRDAYKRYIPAIASLKGIAVRDAARDFHGLSYNGYKQNLSMTAASAIAIYPRERA